MNLTVGYVLDGNQLRIAVRLGDQPSVLLPPLQAGWLRGRLRQALVDGAAELDAQKRAALVIQ